MLGQSVLACDHLSVYIRLGLVDLGDLLIVSRSDLGIVLEGSVAVTYIRLSTDYPSVVVAEDACVFLVAAGVGGDLAVLYEVFGEGRIVKNKSAVGGKVLVYRFKGSYILARLLAKSRKDCKALGLDEDLAFLALLGAYLSAEVVICS